MSAARLWHSATLLRNGEVLVAGGGVAGEIGSAERYDPVSGSWKGTGSLGIARSFPYRDVVAEREGFSRWRAD